MGEPEERVVEHSSRAVARLEFSGCGLQCSHPNKTLKPMERTEASHERNKNPCANKLKNTHVSYSIPIFVFIFCKFYLVLL